MKRALVSGAAGFIGSHVVDRLIKEGWWVTGVDDMSAGEIGNVNPEVELWKCDFADSSVLTPVREGKFDVVFHLAARPRVLYSVEHPAETNDTNVQKTVKLLEACKDGAKRFVFSSSSSVYGGADQLPTPTWHPKSPKSPYALQKSIVEDYCTLFSNLYGLDTVCLRYFNVFGPRAKGDGAYATAVSAWLHAIKNNTPLRSDGDGLQTRDMCFVSNVAEANFLAGDSKLEFKGQCYNVACGDRVSNKEVLDYLVKKYPNVQVVNAPWRAGDVMHTQADISSTERTLGYMPRVRFWEGLEITLKSEGM